MTLQQKPRSSKDGNNMAPEEAVRGNRSSEVRQEANKTAEEAKQSDDARGKSLLRKRFGPFTISRGRRIHGKDSGFASIIESRGGQLWMMWDSTWVTVFEGEERVWPSFKHISHFAQRLEQLEGRPGRTVAEYEDTESLRAWRRRQERLRYGREICVPELSQTFGFHAYRMHRWSNRITLVFDLPDTTVEAVLPLTETWPWKEESLAAGLYLWSCLLVGEVRSGVLQHSERLSLEDQTRLRLDNAIVGALLDVGCNDNVIRLIALNMARHDEEAERKLAEEEHRQEALRISKLRIGKPPQPPYGNEIIDEKLNAFGVRAYLGVRAYRSDPVTFVFQLQHAVRGTSSMHEVAIAARLPPDYWAGRRLNIHPVTEMLVAAGREFRKFRSDPGSIRDPIDDLLLSCWRDAFLESSYGDDIFRQVAVQMAEKEPHVRGSAGDSTPKKDANAEVPQAAPKRQRDWFLRHDWFLRRDWALVLVQLAGGVAALYVTTNGTDDNYRSYEHLYRVVICGLSVYSACVAGMSRRAGWAWLFGAVALIYNPIVRVHMEDYEWDASNLIVGLIFVASALRTLFGRAKQLE